MRSLELTPPERRLELVLRLFTLLFAGFAVGYLLMGSVGSGEYPFVANSVAKDGLFAILSFLAAGDVRQNGWAINLVIALVVSRPNLRRLVGLGASGTDDATWQRRARQQRYVAYGMAGIIGVIGFLMSTKPDLW